MRFFTNISNYETLDSLTLWDFLKMRTLTNDSILKPYRDSLNPRYFLKMRTLTNVSNYETLDSLTLWDFLKTSTLTNISNYETL